MERHPVLHTAAGLTALEQTVLKIELGAARRVAETMGPSLQRDVLLSCLRGGSPWIDYLDLPMPDMSMTSAEFADAYLCKELLRKNPRLPTGIDRDAEGLRAWLDNEALCAQTNDRVRSACKGGDSNLLVLMHKLRQKLTQVLPPLGRWHEGKFKAYDRLEYILSGRFGPGASSSVRGRDVCLSNKYAASHDCSTPTCRPYAERLSPHLGGSVQSTESAKAYLRFVPKDAKTSRPIIIEPTWNSYFQLGIGGYLKKVMRKIGLSPWDQSVNQKKASTAFFSGLATLDLSAASDTIAIELLRQIVPEDWFHLLDTFRSKSVVLPDGTAKVLEKFSSMGNGFTWELESIIFWSVCQLHCEDPTVFGDDMIVTASSARAIMRDLKLLGFKINERKSFWQGPFYESCGHDYFLGVNVRPLYFKGDYVDVQEATIIMANALRRYARLRNHNYDIIGCDSRFRRAWLYLARESGEKTYIPLCERDDGLIRNFDECSPAFQTATSRYKGRVERRAPISRPRTAYTEYKQYLAALDVGYQIEGEIALLRLVEPTPDWPSGRLGVDRSRHTSREVYRGERAAAKLRVAHFNEWADVGPWF